MPRKRQGGVAPHGGRYQTYQKNVKLGAGQQLHYKEGLGFYAGPRVTAAARPKAPVDPFAPLSAAALAQQASQQASAALAPERAEIERQRALAAQRAKADQAAISGLGVTVADMQRGLVPGVQGAYAGAGAEIGDLAKGFSSEVAARMAAGQAGSAEFAASQGAQAPAAVDPTAAADVLYGLGGFIPGASLAAQGAAAGAWAASVPAITGLAMAGDFKMALARAKEEDDEYAQQLIQTASKYPDLRNQALEALRKYEMEKAGYKLDVRQMGIQERAQGLYERQFGETQRTNRVDENQRQQQINLSRSQLTLDRQKLQLDSIQMVQDVKEAQTKGRQIDASASKVLGYIVDKQGREVLDRNGRRIKVKASTSKSGGKGTKEERNPFGTAVEAARELRGDPIKPGEFINTNGRIRPPRGRYLARPGIKGVFPDGTTNNPSLAQFSGQYTFAEAQGFLQARYGLSRAQARKALVASGWKPDGKRPAPRRSGR